MTKDKLSILSHNTENMTKIWQTDGKIIPSATAKYWTKLEEIEVTNIKELSKLLTQLESKSKTILIRGKYVGDEQAKNNDPEYKEGKYLRRNSTFEDQPLYNLMIDIDDYLPPISNLILDPQGAIGEYIEDHLPECFQDASYHFQMSSSAGHEKNKGILKAHVWFWLFKKYESYLIKEHFKKHGIKCDLALFNPVQPHFTANPIFEDGVKDPIVKRSDFVKKSNDEVHLSIDENILKMPNNNVARQSVMQDASIKDPIAIFLNEKGFVKSHGHGGHLNITCPFIEEHSTESCETSTSYFPANTGGYKYGNFYCFHNSCSHRTNKDYLDKIGYDGNAIFNKQNTMETAKQIVDLYFKVQDNNTLLRYSNSWLKYTGKNYIEQDDEFIRNVIWKKLENAKCKKDGEVTLYNPKTSDISGVADALKSAIRIEGIKPNSWINNEYPDDCVSLNNGILAIKERKLLQHSPLFFSENSLPYDYRDKGKPSGWLSFLDEVLSNDRESIETLQEIFGYCLTPDTSQQKMFLLVGPPRSGKGTIGRILEATLGKENVSGANFNTTLSSNFGLQALIGKLAAIFPDIRVSGRSDIQNIVEQLLCISGEDSVVVDRKYKTSWSGTITTRLLFISNEVPQLSESSNALINRFIYLETANSFLGKEDTTLKSKLLKELPEIFLWALDGRERLLKRGKFIQPKVSAYIKDDMRRIGNPISAFIEDRCILGSEYYIAKEELFNAYKSWCDDMGYRYQKHMNVFGRDLLVAEPSIYRSKKKVSNKKKRDGIYQGIALSYDEFDDIEDF